MTEVSRDDATTPSAGPVPPPPAHAGARRRSLVPGWVAFSLAFLAAAIGLVAGPAMPWADTTPGSGSAEAGFARDMTEHHQQAVRMSLIVMDRTTSAELRQLAKDVVLTQTSQIGTMQGWLLAWGVPLRDRDARPMAWMGVGHEVAEGERMPGMASPDEVRGLERLSGAQLAAQYLTLLHVHHTGGIPMAEAILGRTDRPDIDQLAQSIRDSQSAELATLEALLRELGAPVPARSSAISQHKGDGHG